MSPRRGAAGRWTCAAAPRRAHVTATGTMESAEGSAWRGTATAHVDTTVADTTSGAEADWACVSAGAPPSMMATRVGRNVFKASHRSIPVPVTGG